MKKQLKNGLSLAIAAAMMTSPAAFAYNQTDAIEDCQDKIFDDSQYSRYSDAHGVTAQEAGRNSYKVTGLVKDRNKKEHRFNCRIDHREVVSWNVSPEEISDSDKKTAAAVGAGVLGLAILAAAVSGNKDHDDKRSAYGRGEGSSFDDMGYLKQECTNEVRRHLDREHGQVRDLELTHPDLNNRTLTGNGRVSFERGGHRELSFTCNFDRRGQIQDGHYSYAGGDSDSRMARADESGAGASKGGIPLLNATCPGGYEVHADKGGPIYIGGKETKLKKFNDNAFEATGSDITLSLTINPDGSPSLSYTGQGRAHGICTISN
ncbi:exported hypothetical protein [Candidatus Contendobacter odensis Run_B_J11]|uniref:Uncharacterized protein n=2 Tax=Candidatus Contendibacter odensensis TaxID=1400860 RepID=A0A7U7G8L9_9GAMM|nr:exported hypothetical protein [Candidatus Contendobacter odensis Run_B_J11]